MHEGEGCRKGRDAGRGGWQCTVRKWLHYIGQAGAFDE